MRYSITKLSDRFKGMMDYFNWDRHGFGYKDVFVSIRTIEDYDLTVDDVKFRLLRPNEYWLEEKLKECSN